MEELFKAKTNLYLLLLKMDDDIMTPEEIKIRGLLSQDDQIIALKETVTELQ